MHPECVPAGSCVLRFLWADILMAIPVWVYWQPVSWDAGLVRGSSLCLSQGLEAALCDWKAHADATPLTFTGVALHESSGASARTLACGAMHLPTNCELLATCQV